MTMTENPLEEADLAARVAMVAETAALLVPSLLPATSEELQDRLGVSALVIGVAVQLGIDDGRINVEPDQQWRWTR